MVVVIVVEQPAVYILLLQTRQREADLSWVEVTSEVELQTHQAALLSLLSSSAAGGVFIYYIYKKQ